MDGQAWLLRFVDELPGAGESTGGVDDLGVTDGEREALLDLARIAAHGSERWAAPISTYLAGMAMAGVAAEERAAVLRAVVARLE